MADAIHDVRPGETVTLLRVAELYYAVMRPGGDVEPGRVGRVVAAIRARTGDALKGVGATTPIPAGTVLRIPTLREIPRAILCDDPELRQALMGAGYDHANKLLQRTLGSVIQVMGPYEKKPFIAAAVTRAYALTSLIDLDGMDVRTAVHLHDVESIGSIAELAKRSEASLQMILDKLVEGSIRRPTELATQGHAARWRASAVIQSRQRLSARARRRPFQIPFASAQASDRAQHYESVSHDAQRDGTDRRLARRLSLLHRFQAHVIDGNFHALARRWDRAGASHAAARRLFHRLAEDVGAAKHVDDDEGVGLDVAIDTAFRLLIEIPPGDEAPLGAPRLRTTFDDSRRLYRLEADKDTSSTRKPIGKSILLPAAPPAAPPVRIALDPEKFTADYKTRFLNPQLGGAATGPLRIDESVWTDSAAFAAITPFLYGGPVRNTLSMSYAQQGLSHLANQYGSPYFDLVASDGVVVEPWSTQVDYIRDLDLGTCSTDFVDPDGDGTGNVLEQFSSLVLPLSSYCDLRLALGDALYRQNRRSEASGIYADVICAIENFWESTAQTYLATDAQTAFAAVANAALTIARGGMVAGGYRTVSQLTLLSTAYEDGTPVAEGRITSVRTPKDPTTFEQRVDGVKGWFAFEDHGPPTMESTPTAWVNTSLVGVGIALGDVRIFVDGRLIDSYYFEYLYAQGKFQAIASGLNWFGFTDTFVPSWSFDHLFEVASDLAGKAVDTERQVFQMTQLFEQAEATEFLAGQALELAEEQLGVADARVAQAEAAAVLASQQALLTVEQAEAAANQSAFRAGIEYDNSEVQSALVADPETGEIVPADDLFSDPLDITNVYDPNPGGALLNTVLGGVLSGLPYVSSFAVFPSTKADMETARNDFVSNLAVLEEAVGVAQATEAANAAACAVAAAERDVANVVVNQAEEYLGFLAEQTLNSEGLEQLVALASEVHGIYQYQAHRMAWLAQRAAAYESRRSFEFIGWDYETGDQLGDMMSSEFLRADLDALRAELTAGQTLRMQEVKWTVPLSRLDGGALSALRATGSCVFVVRQDWVDREFPGTYLHRLKDLQMSFIGLLPPGGARGVLSMSGISWVRVPNTGGYATGETKSDWTTEALAGSDAPYDGYVMKRLDATPSDVSLSEFNLVGDRAVLSVPRGMLRPLENLGLDTAWTLALPKRSNPFLFENIRDVELTFWFLCCFDPLLQAAQDDALSALGASGQLRSAARLSGAAAIPDQLSRMRGPVASAGQVDNRCLVWRLAGLPQAETARVVRDLRAVCARRAGTTDEVTFRILSQSSPAGVRVTTSEGAALSLVGTSTADDPNPPAENVALSAWLRAEFYGGTKQPQVDPQQRWVVKFCAEHVGSAWEAHDEDGLAVLADSGPLVGGQGGLASYTPGSAWTSYLVTANVRKGGGEATIFVRHTEAAGGTSYALSIGSDVRLTKVTKGRAIVLVQKDIAYPDDEFLSVSVRVFGDATSTSLRVDIDHVTVLEATDTTSPIASGTVALGVAGAKTVGVAFDDVQVIRLTRLGAARETLLSEPFLTKLPPDWVFAHGVKPWEVSKERHKRLDLSRLLNVVLTVDYSFTYASAGPTTP
jgi:hypothetical protein